MTVFIFLGSLLAAMAIGVPIAYALLVSGVALMWHLDLFDAQILAQNTINGADSFPLIAVPFFMLGALTLLNRGYMEPLYHTSTGHKLMLFGVVMMVIGSLMLRKIVSFRG